MALRGNLKDFSLPDVFQLVTFSRKTGVLRIKRGNGDEGSVWFRDGDVFFAQSNWHTELLGERLVRAQRLTPQALAKALELRAAEPEGGRRLGQILVDEGYLADKVLEAFVSEQIQETIFDLMRWDEGDFDFEAMPDVVEEDIGLSVSIENVIMEGSRRLEEWARIRKKIPSMDVVFKMATAPGEGTFEISLKPTEWNLLLLVDGTRSVADLAYATHHTDFEVARIIYGLFSAGLLEFASDEEVAQLRAERAEREAKLEAIEAESRAKAKAAAEATQAREAALEAAAERRVAEQAAAQAASEAAAAPSIAAEPVEEPEFLVGGVSAPTAQDQAVLEEVMGAVLRPFTEPVAPAPAPVEAPAVPHTPVEEPAFMAVEHAEESELPLVPVPSVDDLLTDFAELTQATASVDEAAAAVAEAVGAAVGIPELQPEPEPEFPADLGLLGIQDEALAEAAPEVEPIVEPVAAAPPAEGVPLTFDASELGLPSDLLAPETVEEAAPPVPAPAADFERDLLALGLGELPSDLGVAEAQPGAEVAATLPAEGVSGPVAEVAEPASETPWITETEVPESAAELHVPSVEPAEAVEPAVPEMILQPTSTAQPDVDLEALAEVAEWVAPADDALEQSPVEVEAEAPDFSELLESLDIDAAAEVEPEVVAEAAESGFEPLDFDEDILAEEPAQSGGVISTDAFLEDITLDVGFSGEMTDELSALTGASRPSRPQANVNKLPEPGSAEILHRDTRVDKDTLLKIIDGIKNL